MIYVVGSFFVFVMFFIGGSFSFVGGMLFVVESFLVFIEEFVDLVEVDVGVFFMDVFVLFVGKEYVGREIMFGSVGVCSFVSVFVFLRVG